MQKILVIGQAPPAQAQEMPYDTTMIYKWLEEIGISKEQAQTMFEWDAVFDMFPGHSWSGHNKPTKAQMDNYWERELKSKVAMADKIWLLGRVAEEYVYSKDKVWGCNTEVLSTMHPSKRNHSRYEANKDTILAEIKTFINS